MSTQTELERIKGMLSRGQLAVRDPATGFHHYLYARCPKSGHESPVHRVDKSGVAIIRVVFRCPVCGMDFDTGAENMFLR